MQTLGLILIIIGCIGFVVSLTILIYELVKNKKEQGMSEGMIEYNVQTYVCDKCKKSGIWPKDIYLLRLDVNKSANKRNGQLFIQRDYCESCYKIMSAKIKLLFEE